MKRSSSVVKRGTVTGFLGAATVAAWFLLLDLAAGRPFRVPTALGSVWLSWFGGLGAERGGITVVAWYTLVYIVEFIVAGWVFVFIAEQVERTPSFLLLAAMTAIVLEAVAIVNLAESAQWAGVGIWSVIIANVLAVAVMGWYVWRTHPTLRQKVATIRPTQVRV